MGVRISHHLKLIQSAYMRGSRYVKRIGGFPRGGILIKSSTYTGLGFTFN